MFCAVIQKKMNSNQISDELNNLRLRYTYPVILIDKQDGVVSIKTVWTSDNAKRLYDHLSKILAQEWLERYVQEIGYVHQYPLDRLRAHQYDWSKHND